MSLNEITPTLLHLLSLSSFSHTHIGLAVTKMINCGAGVVDAEYRGNVGVVLFNFGPSDFEANLGDRIGTPYLLLSLDGGGVPIF